MLDHRPPVSCRSAPLAAAERRRETDAVASVKFVTRRNEILALTCACARGAAPRRANLLDVMAQDYVEDQQLDPCKYTEKELRTLKDLIPNDLAAYDAGSSGRRRCAARNAAGACKKGGIKRDETTACRRPRAGVLPPPPPTSVVAGPPRRARPRGAVPTPKAEPTAAPDVATRDVIGLAARTYRPRDRGAVPDPRARGARRAAAPERAVVAPAEPAAPGSRRARPLPPRRRRGRLARVVDVAESRTSSRFGRERGGPPPHALRRPVTRVSPACPTCPQGRRLLITGVLPRARSRTSSRAARRRRARRSS